MPLFSVSSTRFVGIFLVTIFSLCHFAIASEHSSKQQSESADPKNKSVTDELSSQALLEKIDSVRGYGDLSFSFDIVNISYKKDAEPLKNELSVKVRNNQSIVKFESPERARGRAMFKNGDNMWLYIPGTRKTIRVSPLQRLIGEASNGDVVGASFSTNYIVVSRQQKQVDDKQMTILSLEAKRKGTAYQKVKFWLDAKNSFRPVQSEFYSRSGKLLKTAYYKAFKKFGEQDKLHKLLLVDPIKEGHYTWMLFDNYQIKEIPASFFNKEALKRI